MISSPARVCTLVTEKLSFVIQVLCFNFFFLIHKGIGRSRKVTVAGLELGETWQAGVSLEIKKETQSADDLN